MNSAFEIMSFQSRRYDAIPIANIKVINSRNRDQEYLNMNVESINKRVPMRKFCGVRTPRSSKQPYITALARYLIPK